MFLLITHVIHNDRFNDRLWMYIICAIEIKWMKVEQK